jgi:general stress protein 26
VLQTQDIAQPVVESIIDRARQDRVERLRHLVEKIQICMVNTTSADGSIHSRPMAYLHMNTGGELSFFTRADSVKVEEVRENNRVSVTFSDPSRNLYVTVSGHARVGKDAALVAQLYTPGMKRWFPEGPEDRSLRLLTVDPEAAEYWNGPSGLTALIEIARATLTGSEPDPGEHESLTL